MAASVAVGAAAGAGLAALGPTRRAVPQARALGGGISLASQFSGTAPHSAPMPPSKSTGPGHRRCARVGLMGWGWWQWQGEREGEGRRGGGAQVGEAEGEGGGAGGLGRGGQRHSLCPSTKSAGSKAPAVEKGSAYQNKTRKIILSATKLRKVGATTGCSPPSLAPRPPVACS